MTYRYGQPLVVSAPSLSVVDLRVGAEGGVAAVAPSDTPPTGLGSYGFERSSHTVGLTAATSLRAWALS